VELPAQQAVVVYDQHRRLLFRLFGHGKGRMRLRNSGCGLGKGQDGAAAPQILLPQSAVECPVRGSVKLSVWKVE
jgi:hypothetical protein